MVTIACRKGQCDFVTRATEGRVAITVEDAVQRLLVVVAELQHAHPGKRFTLDGRLVVDNGEVLVAAAYDVAPLDGLPKHHDAKSSDGRFVQIKATMKDSLTFPADYVPDFYLGIKIHVDGTFDEVFNEPGAIARRAIAKRKHPKTNLHSISVAALRKLQTQVSTHLRIARRPYPLARPKKVS
jgi:hypothetical protein